MIMPNKCQGSELMVGYARVSITPDMPVPLDGYGNNVIRTVDKNHSPFISTLICTCTNGDFIYVPSKEAYDYGCYERSVSYFDRGTGELAAEIFVQMLEGLKQI